MTKTVSRTLIVLFILLLAGTVYWMTRTKAIPVDMYTVSRGVVESTVSNTRAGTVKSCQRAKLAPAMGGQVDVLNVKKGDSVRTGQILLEIWNRDLKAQVELAERELRVNSSNVEDFCTRSDAAARTAKRLLELKAQGLVPVESVDQAVSESKALESRCQAARDERGVIQEKITVAVANLERTRLRAPFPGVVAEVNTEVGEFVTPSPPGIPTLPAIDLIDQGCLYVTAPIDEVDAPRVTLGQEARVTLDAFPGREFHGTVRRIAPYVLEIEKQARTVEVEVGLSKEDDLSGLLPGYSADVEIIIDRRENTLRIPAEALLDGNRVLVPDATDGTVQEREVKTGLANWNFAEITEGLTEGERIVLSARKEGVKPGVRVTAEPPSRK